MTGRCIIIGGGDCCVSEIFDYNKDTDFLIAADGGYKYCLDFNLTPDLIIGDFDSYSGSLPNDIEIVKLPTKKDDTDLIFAAKCGIDRGFTSFLILGGYGSRPDHNFALYQTMHFIKTKVLNSTCVARGKGFEAYIICNESKEFLFKYARYLSVFALGGDAEGVTIVGAEYPLDNAVLSPMFPLGVSNACCDKCTVSVKSGSLLIMTVDKDL